MIVICEKMIGNDSLREGTEGQSAAEVMVDVFFYGLFMDPKRLRSKGFTPTNPRRASLFDTAISVGRRATLRSEQGSIVHGVVMTLPADELVKLYDELDLGAYEPEAVQGVCEDGTIVSAVTYNAPADADPRPNREYALELCLVAQRMGLPWQYVRGLLDKASFLAKVSLPELGEQTSASRV